MIPADEKGKWTGRASRSDIHKPAPGKAVVSNSLAKNNINRQMDEWVDGRMDR